MQFTNYKITFQNKAFFLQILIYVAVTCSVFFLVYFVQQYLKVSTQLSLGWGLLFLAIVLNKIKSLRQVPGRIFFIITTAIIALRYLLWRTFDTVIYTGPLDFTGTILIYLAECYALTIHFIGMFISIWPLERQPAPLPSEQSLFPSVDIFIPTYTEPEDIVKLTVMAATQIDYPKDKLNVYILDDGSTLARKNKPETSDFAWKRYYSLRQIAKDLGAGYFTREDNLHAKAGNINNALRKTNGDLILVLDCDHVPTKDILKNTAGWFLKDKKLYLVQTPHFFINTTTVEKNIGSFSNAPSEGDMFHYGIQVGMDLWNSSYFCGSAALLRRQFLMESGGVSGNTVTEDAETSIRLHSKGYNSMYIKKPMVCGLSPETFDDYITQRTRWAQGMTQIFVLSNPLFAKGLSIPQRLCYFNSCFFWFFGIARFIFYIGPGLFLLLGQKVYHASVDQVIAYAIPHVLSLFVVMDFLYGRLRRRFFSEIYESVQALFLAPAVISTIFNPKKPSFKITQKGKKIETEFFNPMSTVFFMICLINFIAIPVAVAKWMSYPLFRGVITITFFWCFYNLLLGLVTLGAFWERKQMRQYHRARVKGEVNMLFLNQNISANGAMQDLSLSGSRVEIAEAPFVMPGDNVIMEAVDSYGERHSVEAKIKTLKTYGDKTFMGIEFVMNDDTYPGIVRFVYGDSQRWMDMFEARSKPVESTKVIVNDIYYFVLRGIKGSGERFIYLSKFLFNLSKKKLHAALIYMQAFQMRARKDAAS